MGFQKGHKDFRKIGVKRTPAQIANISAGHIKYYSEHKRSKRKCECIDCGASISYDSKRCGKCYGKTKIGIKQTKEALSKRLNTRKKNYNGHTNSNDGKKRFKEKMSGKNHWNWKGGISKFRDTLESTSLYKEWRQKVFIRDDFTCQDCKEKGGYIEAHHKRQLSELIQDVKKYLPLIDLLSACLIYSPMWDINNGITLCKKCHNKIPKRR